MSPDEYWQTVTWRTCRCPDIERQTVLAERQRHAWQSGLRTRCTKRCRISNALPRLRLFWRTPTEASNRWRRVWDPFKHLDVCPRTANEPDRRVDRDVQRD